MKDDTCEKSRGKHECVADSRVFCEPAADHAAESRTTSNDFAEFADPKSSQAKLGETDFCFETSGWDLGRKKLQKGRIKGGGRTLPVPTAHPNYF